MTLSTATCRFNILMLLGFVCLFGCRPKKQIENTEVIKDSTITLRQKNPYYIMDQSPMDMIYYPENYPIEQMKNADSAKGPVLRIIYSRPHKKEREIFGNDSSALCPYNKPWRLGANEATEIELFKNVIIGGKNLPKGKYTLYAIPYKDRWTLIFNSSVYTWGLHIDSSKDVFKTDVPTMLQTPEVEDFTMQLFNMDYGADLLIAWDAVKVILPIEFAK